MAAWAVRSRTPFLLRCVRKVCRSARHFASLTVPLAAHRILHMELKTTSLIVGGWSTQTRERGNAGILVAVRELSSKVRF